MINNLSVLKEFIDKSKLKKSDICIVGSSALAAHNIRMNNDLDILIRPSIRDNLSLNLPGLKRLISGTLQYNQVIESRKNRYSLIGLNDEELFADDRNFTFFKGFRVVRLEIELSYKASRLWDKDVEDIRLITEYAAKSSDWDWSLVQDAATIQPSLTKAGIQALREGRLTYLFQGIANQAKLRIQSFKQYLHRLLIIDTFKKIDQKIFLSIPVNRLLGNQYRKGSFNRNDVIVRYLAIEEHFKENDYGFNFYKKMQRKRGTETHTLSRFIRLIKSIERRGFSNKSALLVDKKGALIDGSHRLACALYFDHELVPVDVFKLKRRIRYGADWFRERDFTKKELSLIEDKRREIFKREGIFFPIILWPPAKKYFDEIEKVISDQHIIVESFDLRLGKSFNQFTKKIYEIDDVEEWKVQRKLHYMNKLDKVIRVLYVEIPNPEFRLKRRTGDELSSTGAKLKNQVRIAYRDKITPYCHDIIIHTCDNYSHNKQANKIINSYKKSNS